MLQSVQIQFPLGEGYHFELCHPAELTDVGIGHVLALYANAYGDRWVGNAHFLESTMANTTQVAYCYLGNTLVAAANLNRGRIIAVGTDPSQIARGVLLVCFIEALVANVAESLWITVDVGAPAMIKTLLSPRLRFSLVDTAALYESLLATTIGIGHHQVVVGSVERNEPVHRKAGRAECVAFSRSGSYHGPTYRQLVFCHD